MRCKRRPRNGRKSFAIYDSLQDIIVAPDGEKEVQGVGGNAATGRNSRVR